MDETRSPTFGQLLKQHRMAAGLMQEDLAERAGISARGISDLERGVRQQPRRETVDLLATALDLTKHERDAFMAAARRRTHPSAPRLHVPTSSRTDGSPPAPEPPLVGRARELAQLEQHLVGVGPPVLLLAGEPGIGKSRLLREICRHAPDLGWSVVEGGCQRRDGQDPYAPLSAALLDYMARRSPMRLRVELQGCVWLMRLLPELVGAGGVAAPTEMLPAVQERRLMFAAIARFLANVAGPRGTLLVLDDLHWAGSDALDLLAALVRGATSPLRVVGTYRDTEVQEGDSLNVVLADLADAGLAMHRTLRPLSPEEGAQLASALLPGMVAALRERLVQRAGGVPFFLLSYVQGLRLGEVDDPHGKDAMPWTVAQSVWRRVTTLPDPAQDVLGVAAVVGRHARLDLLTAVIGRSESDLLAALEAATRARLLEEEAEGYRFAHDVIREVVEARLSAARRQVLHRQVAQALEAGRGMPAEIVAYHYAQTDDNAAAAIWLERAGDDAAHIYAHTMAVARYEDARRRWALIGADTSTLARLDEKLGLVLRTTGQHDRALTVLERSAAAYQAGGDQESVARTLAAIGRVHNEAGRWETGLCRLQPVLAALDVGAPSRELAALHAVVAGLYWGVGRYRDQLLAAERAAEVAQIVGDERTAAMATYDRGHALMLLGRTEEASAVLGQAVARIEGVGDLETLVDALNALATLCMWTGEFDAARQVAARGLEVAQRRGDPAQIAFMTHLMSWPALLLGDWEEARRGLEIAVILYRDMEGFFGVVYALGLQGWLALDEGRWDEAARLLDEGIALVERAGARYALRRIQRLRADLDIVQGQPEQAQARLVGLLDTSGLEELQVTLLLPTLAWAYLEMGDVSAAREVAAWAASRSRAQGCRLALVNALRVQAMVALRQGHREEATDALDEGLALTRTLRYPYAEARFLHLYGAMQAQQGQSEPARARLDEALVLFQRLGAYKDAEQVQQALASLPDARVQGRTLLDRPGRHEGVGLPHALS